MNPELEVLVTVARRLDALGLAYMITGSTALNYYAVPRMTRDIDLVVEVDGAAVDPLWGAFQHDFYIDREAVRRAVHERAMFNAIHLDHVVKVDFVVRKASEYRREEFARRRRVQVEGHELFLVAPEDLVVSKLDWARESRSERQLDDVRNLLEAVPDLDRSYIARWTARLGLDALYREVGG